MTFVFIGLFLFLILMLIAIRIGINKEKTEIEEPTPVLHQSGIYSVVKRSPREDLLAARPSEGEVRKYLREQNEDHTGAPLSQDEKQQLIANYFGRIETNVNEIEGGDGDGCEFFYYTFGKNDPICEKILRRGQYVTRSDIFKHVELIPPFHLGCTCRLLRQHPDENLSETVTLNMDPFLADENQVPALPDWKTILKS